MAGTGAIGLGLARAAARSQATVGDVLVLARTDASRKRAHDAAGPGIRVVADVEALAGVTLVVEAVAEDLEVKAAVLAALDGGLGPDALLASTTSSLPVEDLAAASGRAARFGALHVFNPVERMPLVELCLRPRPRPTPARGCARSRSPWARRLSRCPTCRVRRQPPAVPVPLLGGRSSRTTAWPRPRSIAA